MIQSTPIMLERLSTTIGVDNLIWQSVLQKLRINAVENNNIAPQLPSTMTWLCRCESLHRLKFCIIRTYRQHNTFSIVFQLLSHTLSHECYDVKDTNRWLDSIYLIDAAADNVINERQVILKHIADQVGVHYFATYDVFNEFGDNYCRASHSSAVFTQNKHVHPWDTIMHADFNGRELSVLIYKCRRHITTININIADRESIKTNIRVLRHLTQRINSVFDPLGGCDYTSEREWFKNGLRKLAIE